MVLSSIYAVFLREHKRGTYGEGRWEIIMRYDAFISYRHSDLDMYVAKKLHKGLETFKVPRAVALKSGKKNIKRVFRDQEELPIGSDLSSNIEAALSESEFLIVICSPRTPESYWVQKEISTFIEMHGRGHVLAVLIEGEPEQSFPSLLLTDDEGNPVEPLAADVRGETKTEVNRKLKTEIMRLAAPLLGCSYDDLRQRHKERRMKRIAAISSSVALLALLFGAYSAYNAALIRQNYEGKQRNQSKYLAETSLSLLKEGDRRAAVLVALEALPAVDHDKPYVAEAQYALSRALYCYDTGNEIQMDRILQHDLPVSNFWLNEDGTIAVSIDQGSNVYVWDTENGIRLAWIAPEIDENGYVSRVRDAIFYEDHIILCESENLRSITIDGEEEWNTENPAGAVYCEFVEDSSIIACSTNEEVNFFDITNGELIASMPNLLESSYADEMAFNQDRTKFAVSHLTKDPDAISGCVSVYDFETQTIVDIATAETFISDVAFTTDDNLAVASAVYHGTSSSDIMKMEAGCIQKIDYRDGAVLWQNTYEYHTAGYEASDAQIKCRYYVDQTTGEEHDEVLMSIDNKAYTWDNESGEQIAETRVDSGIMQFLISSVNGSGFLAGSNGTIDIVNMTDGFRYSTLTIQTNKDLRDVSIKNGVVVVRAFASPDLTVLKYHQGAGIKELDYYDNIINDVQYSADETYYAVSLSDKSVLFYRTKDNALVNVWSDKEDSYIMFSGFMNEALYVVLRSDGGIVYYNVETGEEELTAVKEDFDWRECSTNKDYLAFLYLGHQYALVDLKAKKVLVEKEIEDYIFGGILSEDGRYAYCNIRDKGVCILDIETGEVTLIDLGGYQVINTGGIQDAFAISQNGQFLAVSCMDSILRVLDLKEMRTVAEIPFAGVNRRFVKFSEDYMQIMLQGDDYYFRVYDLKAEGFSHVSIDQYNAIKQIMIDEQSGIINLITSVDMIILNKDDYERIAQVDGGRAYLPESSRILCDYNGQMYQFPYMTLNELFEEANEQFGEESLTDLEKVRFHVE